MTLVEVLVVLALVGTVAGAVGLSLGAAVRGADPRGEAELLAARMRLASEEALLTGQAVALVWSDSEYRFLELGPDGWAPHAVPLLAEAKPLGGPVRFLNDDDHGGFAVTAEALPASGAPLALRLGAEGEDAASAIVVIWDGVTATLSEPGT